jgi:hypothetical protein
MHGTVEKPFLGDKINEIKLLDILVTGKLIKTASVVSIIIVCVILLAG